MERTRRGVEQAAELGRRVRARRAVTGMSQEDLGEASGLHRTYIGHLERGEVNPSLINILKVAAALGTDAGELVMGLADTIGDPRTA
ncbi:MAG: helix-turn-helix transcriptional regulator [Acidimicrobiales bacterium]